MAIKTNWNLSFAATIAFWLGFAWCQATTATPPIALKVTPRTAFEPVTIRADVTIEPNYLNTTVCLLWDSEDGGGGQDCRPLEGQYAAKTHHFEIRDVNAGEYVFQAAIYQGIRWVQSIAVNVTVISRS